MFTNPLIQINLVINALSPYLEEGSIKDRDLPKLTSLLDRFIYYMPYPNYPLTPARLERATRNINISGVGNNRIEEIKYLKYPPPESVTKYNRCNIPGKSVLYGAFHFITAVKELRPNLGDLITHSEWQLCDEQSLNSFPIFFITQNKSDDAHNGISLEVKTMHQNFIKGKSKDEQQYFNLSMEFLAKCFSKKVNPDNHFDYFLSAYISNKIFDYSKVKYEAILYPSVQEKLGLSNMAIKPAVFDSKFYLKEVTNDRFTKIVMDSSNPGLLFDGLNRTDKFDHNNGLIIWKD